MNPTAAAIIEQRLGPSAADDVRAIRQQLNDQCQGDLHRLAEHAREAAEQFRQRRQAVPDRPPGSPSSDKPA